MVQVVAGQKILTDTVWNEPGMTYQHVAFKLSHHHCALTCHRKLAVSCALGSRPQWWAPSLFLLPAPFPRPWPIQWRRRVHLIHGRHGGLEGHGMVGLGLYLACYGMVGRCDGMAQGMVGLDLAC